ncbi:MAG: class I SAM-dependent methyltransferase [Bacillota bacterium]|nr:class I SAM-dependent methyltransferase [Bacillota bacterium]
MSYERFAYLYDELMQEAPYDQWVDYVKGKIAKYRIEGRTLLDLACGTGELSTRFAKEGYYVTGIDLSEDMLAVAMAKSERLNLRIPFYQQDMTELEGLKQFDVIGIFCDSLNYLQSKEMVEKTLLNVFHYLKKGGLFIFDVHSVYKVNEVFMNQTFTFNEEQLAYIWNSFPGEFPNSVEHELSFFVLDEESGKYDRFDELHFQQTYPVESYSDMIVHAGFEILEINADFEAKEPEFDSERIFFVVQKK